MNNFKDDLINTNFHDSISNEFSVDKNYDHFSSKLTSIINKNFHKVEVRFNKYKHKRHDWITNGILISIRERDKLFRKWKLSKKNNKDITIQLKVQLDNYNKILKKTIKHAKLNFYQNYFQRNITNMKNTWSKINELLGNKSSKAEIKSLFIVEGEEITCEKEIAGHFNSFFISVGQDLARTIDNGNHHNFKDYLDNKMPSLFSFKQINQPDIIKYCNQLKSKHSTGHDNISTAFFKQIIHQLSRPLMLIFNQIIEKGVFPKQLKIAKVIPLYKKDDKTAFTNYRPISLLPAVSKLYEKILASQIKDYFNSQDLFFPNQYGFRSGHSTEFATLDFIDKIHGLMDCKETPFSIFMDLSKAFDTLQHNILLYKLENYGFNEQALALCNSYLSGRQQFVKFKNTVSGMKEVKLGVPQGSILGPLFYIIYMNDIRNVNSQLIPICYADDTTLVSSVERFSSFNEINRDLMLFAAWLQANKLSLNTKKTKLMIFDGNKRKRIKNINLQINNERLVQVDTFSFLGIIIDDKLNWKGHLNSLAVKLSRSNAILNRLKNMLTTNILKLLYFAMFSSYLNYGILCWGFSCDNIFKLQKKCIRIISNSKYNAHTDPLFKKLRILKLNDMLKLKMIMFYYDYERRALPKNFLDNFLTRQNSVHGHATRQSENFRIPLVNKNYNRLKLRYALPVVLNDINLYIISVILTESKYSVKKQFKQKCFDNYESDCNIANCYICKN